MLVSILTITAIVSTGLMGGIYFVFSVFLMRSLAELDSVSAAHCMRSINRVILRTAFIPVFFLSSVNVVVLAFLDPRWFVIFAAFIYVLGMMVCTMFFNVPLNNALRDVPEFQLEEVWSHYLRIWTAWNHVRTLSSVAACGLLSLAVLFIRDNQ